MARKRMLAPEMFTSLNVCQLPLTARWTWAGMLTYLDDYGYGEDAPALIKAAVWPRDDAHTMRKVGADLDKIETAGNVCRFSCCGLGQLHAPQWDEWQKVAHPGKPRFCPCPTHTPDAHEVHAQDSGKPHEGFIPNVVEVNSDQSSSSAEARRALISGVLGRVG